MQLEAETLKAGNWKEFDSFCWHGRPDDADQFAIVYTHGRDSDSVARSNAVVIAAALEPFEESGDVIAESHNHGACGWIEGFAIRVNRNGKRTEAAKTWGDICKSLADYPLLDESHHSGVELDDQQESWENWVRHEFESSIERNFDVEIDSDTVELFYALADRSNTYWEEGSIDVDRIVAVATYDDIRPFCQPLSFTIFRDGVLLTYGTYHCGEYSVNSVLYEPELEAVLAAIDRGQDTADLDGVLTWTID